MSAKKPTINVRKVVVCDDVRQEDNGKGILIGVYSGEILLPQLPAGIVLSAWVIMRIEGGKGELPIEFRFRTLETNAVSAIGIVAQVPSDLVENATFALPKFPVLAERESTLVMEYKFAEADWQELDRLSIKKGPSRA